jgi:hypothetical protein
VARVLDNVRGCGSRMDVFGIDSGDAVWMVEESGFHVGHVAADRLRLDRIITV